MLELVAPNRCRVGGFEFHDVFAARADRLIAIGPPSASTDAIVAIDAAGDRRSRPSRLIVDPHAHTLILELLFDEAVFAPDAGPREMILIGDGAETRVNVDAPITRAATASMSTLTIENPAIVMKWIEYHRRNFQIDRFYIYSNTKKHFDAFRELAEKSPLADNITHILWDVPYRHVDGGFSGQTTQQNHTIYKYGKDGLIGLLDVDEYIVAKCDDLVSVMRDMTENTYLFQGDKIAKPNVGAIALQCLLFGRDPHPPGETGDFLREMTRCARTPEKKWERQKCFVVPDRVNVFSVHMVVDGAATLCLSSEIARFNHYFLLGKDDVVCDPETHCAVENREIERFLAAPKRGTVDEALAAALDHHTAGRTREAETLYRRVIEAAPKRTDARHSLAILLAQTGRLTDAAVELDAAIEIDPTRAVSRYDRGKISLALGRATDAVPELLIAVGLPDAPEDAWETLISAVEGARRSDPGTSRWAELSAVLRPSDLEVVATVAARRMERNAIAGRWGDALTAANRAERVSPLSLIRVGRAAEAAGRDAEAEAAYRRYEVSAPGDAIGFTHASLVALRRAGWRPPPTRAAAPASTGRVTMSRLGVSGRFGNQILQYGVARLAAERRGLILETPPWVGRVLFGRDDPPIGVPASRTVSEEETDLSSILDGSLDLADRDLFGYFCGDTAPLAPLKDRFRALFRPVSAVETALRRAETRARGDGETLIVLHLRRGDFNGLKYWIAPENWYINWLAEVWPRFPSPRLYVATDDPATLAAFADYRPVSFADVSDAFPAAPYLVDHWLLRRADMTAISNSTFSFTAAMLNDRAARHVRPDIHFKRLIPFDPWGAPALIER